MSMSTVGNTFAVLNSSCDVQNKETCKTERAYNLLRESTFTMKGRKVCKR